jgi:hypothetical protein
VHVCSKSGQLICSGYFTVCCLQVHSCWCVCVGTNFAGSMGVTCSSEAERVQCSPPGVLLAPILAQSNLLEWSQAVSVICSKHSRLAAVWVLFCLCWYDLPNAVMLSSLAAHGTGSSTFNTRSLSVFNNFNANNQKQ